ncbi:type IV toxin-antitoxin system AbiEi family antitoxin domain-containing protein [Kineosporia sp. A_224]|uniref:type IV toxin-antitoxin system AbiEi family antitoxin domain-containing protein n=1 Tax=Kineosporia sp. A_224 TaxID=1962180 RepID=UPI0018E9492C|nr:type IV toxin-antitoxin system AbiEi family antitoxin domain-containing protein [Kineosporia sp. A_224]
MPRPVTQVDLDGLMLPAAFSTSAALDAGLTRPLLDRLVRDGDLERLGRGLFLRSEYGDGVDTDLVEIAVRAPTATICLTSALARHGLTDEIPAAVDVALPRGDWQPAVAARVAWHRFAEDTFTIGRHDLPLTEHSRTAAAGPTATAPVTIGLYSAERSIIDAFRTRGTTGSDVAIEALRRWLRDPAHQPAQLLALCENWPRTLTALRNALEILL